MNTRCVHYCKASGPTLLQQGLLELDKILAGLTGRTVVFVVTDSRGSQEYNLGLSRLWAESVGVYLVERCNIDPERIVVQWDGESAPVASNATEEGRGVSVYKVSALGFDFPDTRTLTPETLSFSPEP